MEDTCDRWTSVIIRKGRVEKDIKDIKNRQCALQMIEKYPRYYIWDIDTKSIVSMTNTKTECTTKIQHYKTVMILIPKVKYSGLQLQANSLVEFQFCDHFKLIKVKKDIAIFLM